MTFSNRRHDIIAIALLLMIAAALLMDVVAGSSVFYFRDLTRYYFPVKKMVRDIASDLNRSPKTKCSIRPPGSFCCRTIDSDFTWRFSFTWRSH